MTVRDFYEYCCEHDAELKEICIEFKEPSGVVHIADKININDIDFILEGLPTIKFPWFVDKSQFCNTMKKTG